MMRVIALLAFLCPACSSAQENCGPLVALSDPILSVAVENYAELLLNPAIGGDKVELAKAHVAMLNAAAETGGTPADPTLLAQAYLHALCRALSLRAPGEAWAQSLLKRAAGALGARAPSPPAIGGAPSAAAPSANPAGAAPAARDSDECQALGARADCAEYSAQIAKLREKPVEFRHPHVMYVGRKAEITLVLGADWQEPEAPAKAAEEKGLTGDAKGAQTRMTWTISARLSGADFEVEPEGRQERKLTVAPPPAFIWLAAPSGAGAGKRLKLELYAHLQAQGEVGPPVLIKALDAAIDVEARTWDWIVNQARTIEPVYGILAAVLALLTALYMLFRRRRRRDDDAPPQTRNRYIEYKNKTAAPAPEPPPTLPNADKP